MKKTYAIAVLLLAGALMPGGARSQQAASVVVR